MHEFSSVAEMNAHYREVHERLYPAPKPRVFPQAPVVEVVAPEPVAEETPIDDGTVIPRFITPKEPQPSKQPGMSVLRFILRYTAHHYNVRVVDVLSDRRDWRVMLPRHVAMYVAKTITTQSYANIAHTFNRADHTTAYHAIAKIEARMRADADFAMQIDRLIADCREAAGLTVEGEMACG